MNTRLSLARVLDVDFVHEMCAFPLYYVIVKLVVFFAYPTLLFTMLSLANVMLYCCRH